MNAQILKTVFLIIVAGAASAAAAASRMEFPDADTVVVDERTRVEYFPDGTYTVESDEQIQALTEKGKRSLRTVTLYASKRYGDAEIVKVEIIGTNGVVRAVDFRRTLKEATDNSSVTANIYDPLDRKISCSVPGIETGEIRRVVTRERMVKSRMRDTFAYSARFEAGSPIIRSSFEIIQPAQRPIVSVKLRNPLDGTVVRHADKALAGGRTLLKWEASGVPQAFPEPDMPDFSSVSQRLLVSTLKNWQEVSRWYWNLCLPRLEATDAAMTNKVSKLIGGLDGDTEKIRAIFRFVSQEIRYMGLTLEDESPGYAPHDVKLTFTNRYGVCRDKAALLAAMLRIAGFKAYPVLIHAGPKMDADVPIPFFNHAIVAVDSSEKNGDGGFILMDPTNENTKDLLPAYLMDCSYLVAHPQGRPLATVPVKPAHENAFRATTKGSIEPDGSAIVSTKAVFGGANDLFRGSFAKKTPVERRRVFEKFLQASYPGAELLSFEMLPKDIRDTSRPLTVELTARLIDVVIRGKTRDEIVMPFVFSGFGIAERMLSSGTELESRRYPLVFATTALSEEKLELKLGDSVGSPVCIPEDVVAGAESGCFHEWTVRVEDSVLKAVRRRAVGSIEISPHDYLALKSDLEYVEIGEKRKAQFSARKNTDEFNVKVAYERKDIRLDCAYSWTVTNVWEKEVLTYAGKKSSAELSFGFNPCVGFVEIVSATVSNRNGSVQAVSSDEISVLDAGWTASAPRYPASKRVVVNLPAVATGSVIRVVSVTAVTNSPVAFCGLFLFDSVNPIGVKELSVSGCRMKMMECGTSSGKGLGEVGSSESLYVAVTNPVPLPREGGQPPALLWRKGVLVSAADFEQYEKSLFDALAKARSSGSEKACGKARELTIGVDSPEERIKAIRDWLRRNVRVAGPSLTALPFDKAFFPPDRSLEDSYASPADWMNLYFVMLDAVGFDVEFILSAGDFLSYPELVRARREVPQPDDFSDLLISAAVKRGGWLFGLFGGEEKRYILDCESEYTPLGVRNVDGTGGKTLNFMSIDLNETGAARITVSNATWGVQVGSLRKFYSEMLPEMRARHHTELVGAIAESAEAVSELSTDVEGYPFVLSHSVYAPDYAVRSGDLITLEIPGLGGVFLPSGEADRKTPFGIGRRLQSSVYLREVLFPEGFTRIERDIEPWEMELPGGDGVRIRFSCEKSLSNGRLKMVFREEHLPSPARFYPKEYAGFFRDWNRRTGSVLSRTVVVGRGGHAHADDGAD